MTNRLPYPLVVAFAMIFLAVSAASGKSLLAGRVHGLANSNAAVGSAGTFNLSDFGSVGDGIANDGPAFQRALDAIAEAGGGTLFVPKGRYSITTPVFKDFTGLATSLTILGVESLTPVAPPSSAGEHLAKGLDLVSEIYPRTGEERRAIAINGLENFLIQDIAFIGTQEVVTDAQVTLFVEGIDNAVIKHCEFYGLATFAAGGGIVKAVRSHLKIEQSKFLGSTAASGLYVPVVENVDWLGITVTDTHFVDYGLNPDFFSKSGLGAPISWLNIGRPATLKSNSLRREVIIRQVFLDEGAYWGLASLPHAQSGAAVDLIYISGLFMNVSNFMQTGHWFVDAPQILIERSHYGWSHNADSAINLVNAGHAILDQVTCVDHADRIRADSDTENLTIINSSYMYLDSLAQTTRVIDVADEDDPVQYVREQFASTLGRDPDPAAHFYWSDLIIRCDNDPQCQSDKRAALTDYLAGAPASTFSLAGRVTNEDGHVLAGAIVTLSGLQVVTTETNSKGEYVFSNAATSGVYTVAASKVHYTFSAPVIVTTPSGHQSKNFTATLNRHTLSGRVANNLGAPIGDTKVTLSGSQSATATTDAAGNYSFPALPAGGKYILTPSKSSYVFSPASLTTEDLGGDRLADFVLVTHDVTGRVIKKDGSALANVIVTLSGPQSGTVTTDADGNYAFPNLPRFGTYTLTPSKSSYVFSPQSVSYIELRANEYDSFQSKLVLDLKTEEGTDRALALDSMTFLSGPFFLNNSFNLSTDRRTRILLFAERLELTAGENFTAITAQAEDKQGKIYPLAVEFVGEIPTLSSLTQIILILSDDLPPGAEIWVSIDRQGVSSNKARISISAAKP